MVYVLEDEPSILELILYALEGQDIQSAGFSCVEDFTKALKYDTPNVVVLDIMLGQNSGLDVLKSLRTNPRTKDIVILMLTALDSEIDKVKGLDLGADDYITKPFSVVELMARIKAGLRRTDSLNNDDVSFDGLEFSYQRHIVSVNGKEITLTLKEFSLLGFLLAHRQKVFSRDELLGSLWGYEYDGQNRTLDVHIKTLRKKLGLWGKRIQTVHGVGYKLAE